MESGHPSAGSIQVTRALPIDAVLLEDVLLGLRRDADGASLRWTLGERGIAEVESTFAQSTPADENAPSWSTPARLWDARGLVVAGAIVSIIATTPDAATLAVRPGPALPSWWEVRLPTFLDLLHAVLDELAEELLWHATRDRIGTKPR